MFSVNHSLLVLATYLVSFPLFEIWIARSPTDTRGSGRINIPSISPGALCIAESRGLGLRNLPPTSTGVLCPDFSNAVPEPFVCSRPCGDCICMVLLLCLLLRDFPVPSLDCVGFLRMRIGLCPDTLDMFSCS